MQASTGQTGTREAALTPAAAHAFGRYQHSAAIAAEQAAAATAKAPSPVGGPQGHLAEASSGEEEEDAGSDAGKGFGWETGKVTAAGGSVHEGGDSASEADDDSMADALPCDQEQAAEGAEPEEEDGAESEPDSPGMAARMSEGLLRTAPDLDVEDLLGACMLPPDAAQGSGWAVATQKSVATTVHTTAQVCSCPGLPFANNPRSLREA